MSLALVTSDHLLGSAGWLHASLVGARSRLAVADDRIRRSRVLCTNAALAIIQAAADSARRRTGPIASPSSSPSRAERPWPSRRGIPDRSRADRRLSVESRGPAAIALVERARRSSRRDRGPRYHRAMPVLRSRLDPAAAETRANHDALAALVADLRARQAAVAGRGAGGDERSIERHRERGKLPVRERIERLLDPGLGVPRAEPAGRDRPVRRRRAGRRDRHRHRPGRGDDLRRRRQRRHGQGRHLLPDDGQEAPPRPGDRAREPAAVHLPGRLGRRVPAAPGRGLPRPRPLRPDLLQPGPDVGRRRSRRSRW